jgi:hypothetical protein
MNGLNNLVTVNLTNRKMGRFLQASSERSRKQCERGTSEALNSRFQHLTVRKSSVVRIFLTVKQSRNSHGLDFLGCLKGRKVKGKICSASV